LAKILEFIANQDSPMGVILNMPGSLTTGINVRRKK